MFFAKKQNAELERFSELLERSMVALFNERGDVKFSQAPARKKKSIIESDKRMRADGMEKFNNRPTYVSAINYYGSKADMEHKKTLGTVVVYVEQEYLPKLMKLLKYPSVDDESDDAMQDSCGTLCNIIAGRFKSEISSAGYIELEMSHFVTYRNSAVIGVEFCYSEYDLYEISFQIDGEKRLVLEMSMGVVPKQ